MAQCHNCDALIQQDNTAHDWEAVCPKCGNLTWLAPGDVIACTVAKLTQFGVFVEVGDGVKGMVHISELSDKVVEHPSESVSESEVICAKVLRVDLADRRVGLSLKRVHGDGNASLK